MCALALYFMHYNFARPHLEKYRLPVFSGISAIQYVLSLVYPLSCLQDAATKPQMTLVLPAYDLSHELEQRLGTLEKAQAWMSRLTYKASCNKMSSGSIASAVSQ